MKKCPYCAEEIQDEAIKCRYCFSDLTVAPPGTASTATSAGSSPASPMDPPSDPLSTAVPSTTADSGVLYTHSGYRYVLGYGPDFFGIWDRQSPAVAAERFTRSDEGWRQAWTRFASLEPNHVAVPQTTSSGMGSPGMSTGMGTPSAGSAPAMDMTDNDVVQYTHSGQRYLLGYGRTFFGIWDRQAPQSPLERFARDDGGWQQAWRRFTSLETHYTEVGLGGSASP